VRLLPLLPLSDSQPPLTPDGDQARRWAEQELSDPAYAAAQPTPLDRAARAVQDFIAGLLNGQPDARWGAWIALAVGVIVIALVVAAFFIWGRPRTNRRSTAAATDLFGDAESRTAAQLRRAAAAAATAEEWDTAIVLRLRALARGLDEREIVRPAPGATVHAFARAATRAFPGLGSQLDAAAAAFDDVRYLRRPGTAAMYDVVARADDDASSAEPQPVVETVG
jgi:hypothetical protein